MANRSDVVDLQVPYRLGTCEVDPAAGRIRDGERDVKMQPQAIEVLCYLARRPREVIPRSEIEDAIWQGRTVGYDSLTGIMFQLRKALGDDPKQPRIIETISKRGYRLLVEPEPIGGACGGQSDAASVPQPVTSRAKRYPAIFAAAALAVVVAIAFVWSATLPEKSEGKPTNVARNAIVVLPFKSLGSSDGPDTYADGLTDDLTTVLAKNHNLVVIARDSAFLYKDRSTDDKTIAERLKVNFILRGTVRSDGEKLRVNVQLVDAATGSHLWAESYDSKIGQIFNLQQKIVEAIVPVLTNQVASTGTERDLVVRTSSPEAYRAFQLGRQHFYLYLNRPENAKARSFFEQALRHDPNFAMARAMLAWTYLFDATNGWASDREASLRRAKDVAKRAIKNDSNIPLGYFITALVFREHGEYIKAMVEAEKATKLEPNYANAHVLLATLLYYAGRPAESVERLKKAMQLNPHHPFNYSFHLGQAYFVMRKYDEAIKALRAGVASNPAAERLHVWLAAAYAQAGMAEDASWEAEQVRALNPAFSLSAISDAFPFKHPQDRDHFVEALRKAGLT